MYGGNGTLPARSSEREHVVAIEKLQFEKFARAAEHFDGHAMREQQAAARARGFARAHLREHAACIEHALDQHLDLAAALLAAGEPRLDHARVVHHQHVAGGDKRGKFAEHAVAQCAARTVEMQQAARAALGGGLLRDQFRRQFVIEIGEFHHQPRRTRRTPRIMQNAVAAKMIFNAAQHAARCVSLVVAPPCLRDNPSRGRDGGTGRRTGLKIRR